MNIIKPLINILGSILNNLIFLFSFIIYFIFIYFKFILNFLNLFLKIFLIPFKFIYDFYISLYYRHNKIIFFGPSLSGKTTLFFKIYEQFKNGNKIKSLFNQYEIKIITDDGDTKDYLENLRSLVKNINWPPKTTKSNNHICDIKVSNLFSSWSCKFIFNDSPGELFNDFQYNKNDIDYINFHNELQKSMCIMIIVDPTQYFCDQNYQKNAKIYFELFKDLKYKKRLWFWDKYKTKKIAFVFTKKDDFKSAQSLDEIVALFKKDAEISDLTNYFTNIRYFYLNSFNGIVANNSSIKVPPPGWDPNVCNPDINELIKFVVDI